jgi:hypothetical protein
LKTVINYIPEDFKIKIEICAVINNLNKKINNSHYFLAWTIPLASGESVIPYMFPHTILLSFWRKEDLMLEVTTTTKILFVCGSSVISGIRNQLSNL